jgi:outer membrane receptor protein involved in Fe transport
LSYFPTPLSAGNPDGTNNMVDSSVTERAKYYNLSWRVDHNISTNQRIFARVSIYRRDSTYNNYFNNLATGVTFQFLARSAVFDHVAIISPTTVLNTKYSYSRFIRYQEGNRDADGFDLTQLGFPAAYNNAIPMDVRTFPQFNMTGYIPTASAAGENRPVNNHTLSSTLNKVQGSHSLRTGFEFRVYQENDKFFGFQQSGTFNFDSTWTRGPLDNSPVAPGSIGQSVAALLLGLPTATSNVARSASYAEQSNSWGFFVQDDWKATPKLTVNIGLRYEFEQPLHERYNRSVLGFDPNYVQPFSAAAQAAYAKAPLAEIPVAQFAARGGLTFAGINGNPSSLYNTPKTEWMPRLGLAYQLGSRTVLRSGFGIFYGFLGARRGDVIQSGYSQNTNVVPTTDNINFIGTLSNPFPNGISEPVGAAAGPQTFLGQTISYFNQNPQPQRVFRWELGLQHQLKGGILLDVNYTGNKTIHIDLNPTGNPNVINTNPLPDRYLCTSPVRDNTCNNYLTGTVPNPFYGLGPAGNTQGTFTNTTIARSTLLTAFPEFGTINSSVNTGYSWYHSMTVAVEKRFAKGFTASGNYTFSKFMQADELLNPGDKAPLRVISDQDVPHRFSISSVAELPFGLGKPLFSNLNPVASRLVSGWQISGIFGYQVGFPLAWGNVLYYGNPADITKPAGDRSVDSWFNTKGFETATANQLANNLRTWPLRFSQIRGRNGDNVDLALIKNTRITEGRSIQFRMEALNAFNHPGFPSPQMGPTSATFGRITPSNQAGYPRRLQLALKYIF